MFAPYENRASTYARVAIESGVEAADPHRLIAMLYDGAIFAMIEASRGMQANDIPAKGKAISRAIQIIEGGLLASLDVGAGGDLAEQLASLYRYMSHRLLEANLQNRPDYVEEVQRLLGELRDAWSRIRPAVVAPAAPARERAASESFAGAVLGSA